MNKPRLTLAKVNQALEQMGIEERLVKGQRYFYFWEGNAATWTSTMVCVERLNELTLNQWLNEYKNLSSN